MDPDSFGIHYGLLPCGRSWIGHEGDDEVSKLPEGRAVHHLEHCPQRGDFGALRLARRRGNFAAYGGWLRAFSSLAYGARFGSHLVLESNRAFNRTIYHLHQELEFTVPFEDTFGECRRFIGLYQEMYRSGGLPYALFEVRFTPEGHDRTLIGAGRDRRSTWLDLVCNDARGFERFYAAAEEVIKEIGARPHLGKFCQSLGKADLARLHGDNFTRFLDLVEEHDPERKFANPFTRRLFG
jgi:hypothetical protein